MKKLILLIILLFTFSGTGYADITLTQTTDGWMAYPDQVNANIENLKKHTVIVMEIRGDKMYRGAGIAIDKRHILTVEHVTSPTSRNFYLEHEGSQPIWATVVKTDPTHDLALIEIDKDAPDLIAEPMTFAKDIALKESVYTIGHPKSKLYSLTEGKVRWLNAKGSDDITCIELDIRIKSGNSGGFVINQQGEIVGMIFSAQDMVGNMAFMIGKDDVQTFLEDVKS